MPDLQDTPITLTLPPPSATPLRITFTLRKPLDPAHRALATPSNRVAIRLHSLQLQ